MAEDDVDPKQIDAVEIFDPEMRLFKAWGSVEIRDRDDDLLPMDEFKKIMPIIIKRGGALIDRHSNRQVGKILNYEFKEKQTREGLKEGVFLTGEVYKNYEIDDMVWQGIKDGIYKGLSFGGRNKLKDVKFDKKGLTNVLTKLEGFEFSFVPGMGNQESTMQEVNYLAKGKVDKAYEKDGAHVHAEDSLGLHNHPEIEKAIMEMNERILKIELEDIENPENTVTGGIELSYSSDEKKKNKLTEKSSSLSSIDKNSEKYLKENELNKDMEPSESENIQKNSEAILEINKKLDLLIKQEEDKKPEDKKPEEDEEKKKQAKEEDEEDKDKKKEDEKPDEEDKKPEEEVDKANGAEGEKKVQLPKVPAEETGGGEPAEGGEGEDVKFVEKAEFDEVKKKLDSLINKSAQTPRPATELNKALDGKAPKNQKDITKMIQSRSVR